jgi:hypothetical protein
LQDDIGDKEWCDGNDDDVGDDGDVGDDDDDDDGG